MKWVIEDLPLCGAYQIMREGGQLFIFHWQYISPNFDLAASGHLSPQTPAKLSNQPAVDLIHLNPYRMLGASITPFIKQISNIVASASWKYISPDSLFDTCIPKLDLTLCLQAVRQEH